MQSVSPCLKWMRNVRALRFPGCCLLFGDRSVVEESLSQRSNEYPCLLLLIGAIFLIFDLFKRKLREHFQCVRLILLLLICTVSLDWYGILYQRDAIDLSKLF